MKAPIYSIIKGHDEEKNGVGFFGLEREQKGEKGRRKTKKTKGGTVIRAVGPRVLKEEERKEHHFFFAW